MREESKRRFAGSRGLAQDDSGLGCSSFKTTNWQWAISQTKRQKPRYFFYRVKLLNFGSCVFSGALTVSRLTFGVVSRIWYVIMTYSSRQAARKLGIPETTLSTYLSTGKIAPPRWIITGNMKVYLWAESDIGRVRKLLPKIANGRKTRWQRQREKQKAQPRAAALPKKRRTKKKK